MVSDMKVQVMDGLKVVILCSKRKAPDVGALILI